MDTFKTERGEIVNAIPIEDRFQKNSYIKQSCLIGSNLPQPVLFVVLSEAACKLEKKEVEKSLKKTLSSANNQLAPFEKVSHIYIVQEPWTLEHKRDYVHAKYIDTLNEVIKSAIPIIWE